MRQSIPVRETSRARNFSPYSGLKLVFRPPEDIMSNFWSLKARIALITALAAGMLLIAAHPAPENIEIINHDPGRFHGKEITIAGRVVNSFAVMGQGVFLIDDGTGRLWVFSDKFGVPGRDIEVEVTGKLEQGFTFHGRNYVIILRETQDRRG